MKRCHHIWEEQFRAYSPPLGEFSVERGGTIDLVEKLTFGITTIELRCEKCRDLKHHTVIGKAER